MNLVLDHRNNKLHQKMADEIIANGGRIDAVYFSPDLHDSGSKTRKPESGMGLQAKQNFPEIDFQKSIMIGDRPTDMEFGKRVGMTTVFVGYGDEAPKSEIVDYRFSNLAEFAKALNEPRN